MPPGKPLRWVARKDNSCRAGGRLPGRRVPDGPRRSTPPPRPSWCSSSCRGRRTSARDAASGTARPSCCSTPAGKRIGESAFEIAFDVDRDGHLMTLAPERPAVADAVVDVEDLAAERTRLRGEARELLGVTGSDEAAAEAAAGAARTAASATTRWPRSGTLSIVDSLQGYAFTVLTPEISRSLGIGPRHDRAAARAQDAGARRSPRCRRPRSCSRSRAARWSSSSGRRPGRSRPSTPASRPGRCCWPRCSLLDGLSTGSANTLTQPLLMDSYPPPARVRVFSYVTAHQQLRQRPRAAAGRAAGRRARLHLARRVPRLRAHVPGRAALHAAAARPGLRPVRHRAGAGRRPRHGRRPGRRRRQPRLLRDHPPAAADPDRQEAARRLRGLRHAAHPVLDLPVVLPRRDARTSGRASAGCSSR